LLKFFTEEFFLKIKAQHTNIPSQFSPGLAVMISEINMVIINMKKMDIKHYVIKKIPKIRCERRNENESRHL
jgi:hypothetical protein